MRIRNSRTTGATARRPGASGFTTGRRLITLILGLVLVIMLMNEAGNPEVYKRLFHRLGVPMVTHDGKELSSVPTDLPVPDERKNAEIYDGIIASLSDSDREILTRSLAKRRGRNRLVDPSDKDSENESEESANRHGELSAAVGSAAHEAEAGNAQAIETAVFRIDQDDPRDSEILMALQEALDKTYFRSVEDGTVWNANDFQAFYRSLESRRDGEPFTDRGIYVGVVPLIEQSVVYRGRHVQMTGHAVQATRLESKPNVFGIESYWMVWLRPMDGSERPVVVYTPTVSPEIAKLSAGDIADEGPVVVVDGVFVKRYLYRSVGGYDQSPALVAQVEVVDQTTAAVKPSPAPVPIMWVVAAAAAIGFILTMLALRSANRSDRRHRTLRANRHVEPLDQLDIH